MSKTLDILLAIITILAIAFMVWNDDVIKVQAGEHFKVVDGDSLEIGSRRIRLFGIDSPEYPQNCYDAKHKSYSCGIKAKHYMEKLVSAGRVECRQVEVDRYKRSLSVCYSDGKNINEEMVKAGWALAYRDDDGIYTRAEIDAKKHKRGVWQGKFMRPELYRFKKRRDNS